jgi:predicted regulator of Ras-like GTPase activity (Roadblock/LC7/MglB family)
MSSVQPPPESASRAARLDRILLELLQQTPGVEAAAVVSFDGLPMASALPAGMDEDRVAAMSAALLSLAERAAQGLGRGDLSQVYIEGEHGTVFLVSAQDEGVLIAVTTAGAKVGMMLYEVKLAANRVGEVLHGPAPLPTPLPSHVTRPYLDAQDRSAGPDPQPVPVPVAAPVPAYVAPAVPAYVAPAYSAPAYVAPAYSAPPAPAYTAPAYTAPSASDYPVPAYSAPGYTAPSTPAYTAPPTPAYTAQAYIEQTYAEQAYVEPATTEFASAGLAPAEAAQPSSQASAQAYYADPAQPPSAATDAGGWSSYAPSGSVLPGEQGSWS